MKIRLRTEHLHNQEVLQLCQLGGVVVRRGVASILNFLMVTVTGMVARGQVVAVLPGLFQTQDFIYGRLTIQRGVSAPTVVRQDSFNLTVLCMGVR